MTAPDSRDSVDRIVAEMRRGGGTETGWIGIDTARGWADRLQALAHRPQQAGGEDVIRGLAGIAHSHRHLSAAPIKAIELITALQAEVARLREEQGEWQRVKIDLMARVVKAETAEAALREAGRDAERWRFLTSMDVGEYIGLVEYNNPDELAHAIDAARLVRDGDSGEGES